MSAPFDELQPFSFTDVAFPYESYSVNGGIRKHKHEYPHKAGAAVEKLGRDLYEIHVSVKFTAGFVGTYNDLQFRLGVLRERFEQQTTGALNIPHIGTIQACADKWTEGAKNTNRSTITAELTFFEDLNSALRLKDTVTVSSAAMGTLADDFRIAHEGIPSSPAQSSFSIPHTGPNTLDIFQAIDALSVAIVSIKDQQELYGALVTSKIHGLKALFRQADKHEPSLNDPENHLVLEAMHALWKAVLDLEADLQNTGFRAQIYVTKTTMSISQVSFAIYGNTLATAQLLQLNDCRGNPFAIPPQTQIIYYPALRALAA